VLAPETTKDTVPPEQIVAAFTIRLLAEIVTVAVCLALHPEASVPVTVYMVVEDGVTATVDVVAPVFHE
jgi:hypothetical protein